MQIVIHGLDELANMLGALSDVDGMVERAAHAAAERLRDEVISQPWGAGNPRFPVKTGALRDSGRVDGNTLYWDDLEYAGVIEQRGGGFFGPVVEEKGPEIFKEEIQRELEAAIGDWPRFGQH